MSIDRDAAEIIRRYGAGHADTYGDLRWDDDHYVVSFTGALEEHRCNLRSLVAGLAEVEVVSTRYPSAYLSEVIDAVRAEFHGDERRILSQSGPGHRTLRAPFADIAAELHRRYGDALDITVGSKAFPPERITEFRTVPLPISGVDLPQLAVELHLDSAAVAAGDDLRGTAALTNRGQDRLSFLTGLMTGGVRHPGDDKPAGSFIGAVATVGLNVDLRHGQSRDVPVVIGTASCLPDRSYVVPAGAYEVVAALSVSHLHDHGRPTGRQCFVVIGPTIEVTLDGPAAS